MISESKANDEVSGASTQPISNLVRKYFSAYQSGDRKALEELLADEFTFSYPLDDRIGKAQYFGKCWLKGGYQERPSRSAKACRRATVCCGRIEGKCLIGAVRHGNWQGVS